MSTPTCECVPLPRIFGYDDSQPTIPYGDLRTSIGDREYYSDQTITDFELPVCKTIGSEAFANSSLKYINAPMCTNIGNSAFFNCNEMAGERLDFSGVTVIGERAFEGCDNWSGSVPSAYIPNVVEIKASAFSDSSLRPYYDLNRTLELPKCEIIGNWAFGASTSNYNYDAIRIVKLPAIKTIGNNVFRVQGGSVSRHLNLVELGPNCTEIGTGNFSFTSAGVLYVRAVTPPSLWGAFAQDPAHIYVPASSVNAYKSASNWSTYSSIIEAIPET